MSIPYYISEEVKSWLTGMDVNEPDTIFNCIGNKQLKEVVDVKNNKRYLCGVITLKFQNKELPVLLVAGHVYDKVNRIYNMEFSNYYVIMGVQGVNAEKSKYFMSESILQFFIKNKIDFLPAGVALKDLKLRKVNKENNQMLDKGWIV